MRSSGTLCLLLSALTACSGDTERSVAMAEASVVEDEPAAGVGKRYETGFATLETEVDPASVALSFDEAAARLTDRSTPESLVAEEEHGEHDGHDHAEDPAARRTPEAGEGLKPALPRYMGGISMIEGAEKEVHFGQVRAGESRQHSFEFVSNGKEDLVITGVKPSCGCTKAEIELYDGTGATVAYDRGQPIPTGTRFRLLTEISTEGKKGNIGANVSIYTNTAGGNFNVRLMAEVEPVLDVDPESTIYFGQMTTADVREEVVRVTTRRGEPFLLTADTRALANVTVTLEPENPDAAGRSNVWTAKIVAGPGLPIGIRNYPCTLTSDLPIGDPDELVKRKPAAVPEGYDTKPAEPTIAERMANQFHSVPLAIQARITGLVHAEPAFVGFGMVSPGQVIERNVRVECHDDFKLSVDAPITFEGLYGGEFEYANLMETSASVTEDGKYLDILVRLLGLPEDVNGSFGGVMKIEVAHPSMPELPVRFSGVCRASLTGSGN